MGGYENEQPGGSLRLWRDYFPRSMIVGLDLHVKTIALGPRVRFVQGNQAEPADLMRATEALGGPPDIVIDDGSHQIEHAEESFRALFPLMTQGALYVIEDTHTSYWPAYGGGSPAPASTAIGLVKSLVDDVQSHDPVFDQYPQWGPRPIIDLGGADALHVYPGIVFIEKGSRARR
ncbi:MAG: hypothetical protein ABIX10_07370 [Acidimicrobiales bacterium]